MEKKGPNSPKRKVRKGGDTALAFLAEKAEKERKIKEKSNRLERERLEYEKEKTEKFMQQQRSDMLAAMVEIQRQQNNQVKPSQMNLLQQQQQQGQSLIALLSKIVDKEN